MSRDVRSKVRWPSLFLGASSHRWGLTFSSCPHLPCATAALSSATKTIRRLRPEIGGARGACTQWRSSERAQRVRFVPGQTYTACISSCVASAVSGGRSDKPFPPWREQPQDDRDQEKGRNIAHEMAVLPTVGKRLCPHDCRVHDARPDGERDKAAVLARVSCRGDQIEAQHRIDPA